MHPRGAATVKVTQPLAFLLIVAQGPASTFLPSITHLLQRAPQHPGKQVAVVQVAILLRQLHKVC
jgi:hypothetical protein